MPEGVASKRRYVTIIKMTVFWCKGQNHSRVCDMMGQVYLYSNVTRNIHNTRLVSIIHAPSSKTIFILSFLGDIYIGEYRGTQMEKIYLPNMKFRIRRTKNEPNDFHILPCLALFSPTRTYSHEMEYYCDFVKIYVRLISLHGKMLTSIQTISMKSHTN